MVARTGSITSAAGLCLDGSAGSNNNEDDDRVRLWDCDGTAGQVWTVADDGTLRALGMCLQATSGLVRLRVCDGNASQQWRAGSVGSLVSDPSGLCLGDPAGGNSRGAPQRTAPCDQSDAQRWALP